MAAYPGSMEIWRNSRRWYGPWKNLTGNRSSSCSEAWRKNRHIPGSSSCCPCFQLGWRACPICPTAEGITDRRKSVRTSGEASDVLRFRCSGHLLRSFKKRYWPIWGKRIFIPDHWWGTVYQESHNSSSQICKGDPQPNPLCTYRYTNWEPTQWALEHFRLFNAGISLRLWFL